MRLFPSPPKGFVHPDRPPPEGSKKDKSHPKPRPRTLGPFPKAGKRKEKFPCPKARSRFVPFRPLRNPRPRSVFLDQPCSLTLGLIVRRHYLRDLKCFLFGRNTGPSLQFDQVLDQDIDLLMLGGVQTDHIPRL